MNAKDELKAAVNKTMREHFPVVKADPYTYVDAAPFNALLLRAQELFPQSIVTKLKAWPQPTISPVDLNHLYITLNGWIEGLLLNSAAVEATGACQRTKVPDQNR
jgi:hypothetical protein